MALPDWQKRNWVDVPPGTTAPADAPARDAAWHTTLDDFLGAVPGAVDEAHTRVICTSTTRPAEPRTGLKIYETDTVLELVNTGTPTAPVWEQLGGGSGGDASASLTEIGINDVFIPNASVDYGNIYMAQMLRPRLDDLQITGVRLPFTHRSGDAYSVVVHHVENFEEAVAKYSRALRPVGLEDFTSQGNAEQVIMFSAPVPLVAGSIYEVGIGVDENLTGTGAPLLGSGGIPHAHFEGVQLGALGVADSRSGVYNHYWDSGSRTAMVILCEQTGAAHVDPPITVADPHSTIEPPADPAGQLTPYYIGREFGGRCYHSYTITPEIGLSITGAVAELTPSGAALAVTLYDSAHTMLEEVAFTGDGADQTVSFASPVALTAGTTYEIAYRATADTTVGVGAYLDVGPRSGNSDLEIVQSYRDFSSTDGTDRGASGECGRMKLLYTTA